MSHYDRYQRIHPALKRVQLAEIRRELAAGAMGHESAVSTMPVPIETGRHIAVHALDAEVQVVPVAVGEHSVSSQ